MKKINTKIFFIYVLLLILFSIFLEKYFIQNISWLLSKQSLSYLFQNRWDLVVLYIIIFSIFLFFLSIPRKHGVWKGSHTLYIAFIVALFTEMFGFPLTIYFLSSFANIKPVDYNPVIVFTFEVNGMIYNLLFTSLIAGIVSVIGIVFIVLGWKKIYKSRSRLVTDGIYNYLRHPQYLGILIIVTAWLFAWPTVITLIMWPILLFSYYRLAKSEDKLLEKKFGKKYIEYKERTSMFIPLLYSK